MTFNLEFDNHKFYLYINIIQKFTPDIFSIYSVVVLLLVSRRDGSGGSGSRHVRRFDSRARSIFVSVCQVGTAPVEGALKLVAGPHFSLVLGLNKAGPNSYLLSAWKNLRA
jgi:hypothetical protein